MLRGGLLLMYRAINAVLGGSSYRQSPLHYFSPDRVHCSLRPPRHVVDEQPQQHAYASLLENSKNASIPAKKDCYWDQKNA
jgi:hypothetical protein